MARRSRQNPNVRDFILRNVGDNPGAVGAMAAKKFGLSRTAIHRYLRRLIDEGLLTAAGKTNARRYGLRKIVDETFKIKVSAGLPEDVVWRFRILPHMKGVKKNIIDLCQYGFTEMLNNVIDHSASHECLISYQQNYCEITIMVKDNGVGIFKKIQRDFGVPDSRGALLELSKGKLSSDEARHSGEGIYFTSRMFDEFSLRSGDLFYSRTRKGDDDWSIETGDIGDDEPGTAVLMTVSTDAAWTPRDVFNKYQGEDVGFRRTHVPLKLGKYPDEQLVSRSQAKRVLARFEDFSEVIVDFDGVSEVGQAFADEIFRVFHDAHPEIGLFTANAGPDIEKMIAHVQKAGSQR